MRKIIHEEEFLVSQFIKTFQGVIVENYPCKGISLSEATPHYLEGLKPVNPRTVVRNKKGEI
jgi:hypothetical protein